MMSTRTPCRMLFSCLFLCLLCLSHVALSQVDSHGLELVNALSLKGRTTDTTFSFGMSSEQPGFVQEADTATAIDVVAHIYPASADIGKTADIFVVAVSPAGLYMRDGAGEFIRWNGKPAALASAYGDVDLASDLAVTLFSGRHNTEGNYRYFVGYIVNGDDDLVYSSKAGRFTALRGMEALLWRVSNGTNEIFVGGTIHLLAPDDIPPPSLYIDAYDNADILVTEIDPDDLQDVEALQQNAPLFLNPAGTSLRQSLSAMLYAAVQDYLAGAGEDIANYEIIHPNWVAVSLQNLAVARLGYVQGVDNFFMELAAADGKTTWGLESVASQILTIRNLSPGQSAETIIGGTLAAIESGELAQSLAEDINAWNAADIAHFEDAVALNKLESPFDNDLLLTNRNANWLPQLEQFLVTGDVEYILVGTAHVVGEDSILEMLEDRGYLVEKY